MVLSLEALRSYDFQVSGVNILLQKPTYRVARHTNRKVNGFLYILHGCIRYTFQGGGFTLTPGSVVYLPSGSAHTLEILDDDITFFRIDFQITVGGELVQFSTKPLKLCQTTTREFAEAVQMLAEKYQYLHDSIGKTRLICTMFQELTSASVSPGKERLSPAIRYLLEHLTQRLDCSRLAGACNLSSAQFYSLFREEYHMTPLQYRDSLLLHKATLLLQDSSCSVSEVADLLGFESVAYFSRFFKKHIGVSPSNYLKASE